MTLAWPQLTYLALLVLSLGINFAEATQSTKGVKNLFISVVGSAITLFLLYEGGFFG